MRPIYSDLLNEIPIVKNQIVACAGQSHPWFSKSYVTISDFRNMPFITFDDTFNLHTQIMERFHSGILSETHSAPYPNLGFGYSSSDGSRFAPFLRYAFTFSP